MKRYVSYLYSTYNNQKIHNAGFARVELRTGRNRIDIHLRENGYAGKTGTVYLFTREQENIQGIPIGSIVFRGSQADFRYEQAEENIGQTPWQIDQMHGIIIMVDDRGAFLSQWDEEPVDTTRFKIWKEQTAEAQGKADKSTDTKEENINKAKQNQEKQNQAQLEQEGRNTKIKKSQQHTQQQNIQKAGSENQKARNQNASRQNASGQNASGQNASSQNASRQNAAASQNAVAKQNTAGQNAAVQNTARKNAPVQNTSSQNAAAGQHTSSQNTAVQNAASLNTASQNTAIQNASAQKVAERNTNEQNTAKQNFTKNIGRQNTARQNAAAQNPPNQYTEDQNTKSSNPQAAPMDIEAEKVSDLRTAELQPQQSKDMQWDQTWRYMLRTYPGINQFADKNDVLCVRIEIKDVRLLPEKYWSMINNSFLLHGFFNYRHLAFGRIGQSWFIGIPGVYQNQEHVMASIFGFTDFLPQIEKNERGEQPGYWYRILDVE